MTIIFLTERVQVLSNNPLSVDKNWAQNFIQYYLNLKFK